MKSNRLLTLVQTLRACSTHETTVSREMFIKGWEDLVREDMTGKPSLPVMAALLIHDDRFGRLLGEAETQQLAALVQLALDRYDQQTNPPNKFGKLLAGCILKDEI